LPNPHISAVVLAIPIHVPVLLWVLSQQLAVQPCAQGDQDHLPEPIYHRILIQVFQLEWPASKIQLTADLLKQLINAANGRKSVSHNPALEVEKRNEALTQGFNQCQCQRQHQQKKC